MTERFPKMRIIFCIIFSLFYGAASKTINVASNGIVTLQPHVEGEIENILWMHDGDKMVDWDNKAVNIREYLKFKGRIKLDVKTGDVTFIHLTKDDSGFYDADIIIQGRLISIKHRVEVIDPVTEAKVTCLSNATLHCEAEGDSLDYSWFGPGLLTAEMRGQTGPQISKENQDSVYTCVVNNPVSYSSVTYHVRDCFTSDAGDHQLILGVVCAVAVIGVVGAAAGLGYYCYKINSRGQKHTTGKWIIPKQKMEETVVLLPGRHQASFLNSVDGEPTGGDQDKVKSGDADHTFSDDSKSPLFHMRNVEGKCENERGTNTGTVKQNQSTINKSPSGSAGNDSTNATDTLSCERLEESVNVGDNSIGKPIITGSQATHTPATNTCDRSSDTEDGVTGDVQDDKMDTTVRLSNDDVTNILTHEGQKERIGEGGSLDGQSTNSVQDKPAVHDGVKQHEEMNSNPRAVKNTTTVEVQGNGKQFDEMAAASPTTLKVPMNGPGPFKEPESAPKSDMRNLEGTCENERDTNTGTVKLNQSTINQSPSKSAGKVNRKYTVKNTKTSDVSNKDEPTCNVQDKNKLFDLGSGTKKRPHPPLAPVEKQEAKNKKKQEAKKRNKHEANTKIRVSDSFSGASGDTDHSNDEGQNEGIGEGGNLDGQSSNSVQDEIKSDQKSGTKKSPGLSSGQVDTVRSEMMAVDDEQQPCKEIDSPPRTDDIADPSSTVLTCLHADSSSGSPSRFGYTESPLFHMKMEGACENERGTNTGTVEQNQSTINKSHTTHTAATNTCDRSSDTEDRVTGDIQDDKMDTPVKLSDDDVNNIPIQGEGGSLNRQSSNSDEDEFEDACENTADMKHLE